MLRRLLLLLALLALLLLPAQSDNFSQPLTPSAPLLDATSVASKAAPAGEFVATSEWQEVQEGQAIPPGLHVRMDVYKGGKWAKLLDPEEGSSGAATASGAGSIVASVSTASPGTGLVSVSGGEEAQAAAAEGPAAEPPAPEEPSEVTAALSGLAPADAARSRILLGLPVPEVSLASAVAAQLPPEQLAAVLNKVWAERQEQVRSAWASFKTEGQQMAQLMGGLGAASAGSAPPLTPQALLATLEDLEYHVSNVHNAEDFAAMGGLAHMARLLNATSPGVAAHAAWVLGSAVKGQPALIDAALGDGAGLMLASLFEGALPASSGGAAAAQHLPAQAALRTLAKGLYAAGALTRHHRGGQLQFAALGGARVLRRALEASCGVLQQQRKAAGVAEGEAGAGAEAEAARAVAVKALHLLADLHLGSVEVAAKDSQAPTNGLLRFRLEAAEAEAAAVGGGGNGSAGGGGGGEGEGGEQPVKAGGVKVVLLEEQGAVSVEAEEGAASLAGSASSAWLEEMRGAARSKEAQELCSSAREALRVVGGEEVSQEEAERILLIC